MTRCAIAALRSWLLALNFLRSFEQDHTLVPLSDAGIGAGQLYMQTAVLVAGEVELDQRNRRGKVTLLDVGAGQGESRQRVGQRRVPQPAATTVLPRLAVVTAGESRRTR